MWSAANRASLLSTDVCAGGDMWKSWPPRIWIAMCKPLPRVGCAVSCKKFSHRGFLLQKEICRKGYNYFNLLMDIFCNVNVNDKIIQFPLISSKHTHTRTWSRTGEVELLRSRPEWVSSAGSHRLGGRGGARTWGSTALSSGLYCPWPFFFPVVFSVDLWHSRI